MAGFNKRNGTSGTVPEFGAIFMSSTSTKNECLSRKLFGLPSSQASFVKQVKEGMVLFLFEFEKRQLHGVFRASCDGALNIEPRAYSSSGQQFPAQVKFTQIWHSEPLSEHEFRDAIIDNYFSSKKFNFGLSRDQVYKLLLLFNSRKLNRIPERQSTRKNVKRSMQQPPGKHKGSVDDHRLLVRDSAEVEFDAENYRGPFYSRDSFDEVERVCDGGLAITNGDDSFDEVERVCDGGLAITNGDEYCHNSCVEPPLVQSNHYQGTYPRNFERVDDDNDWFSASDRVRKSGQFNLAEYTQCTLSKPLRVAGDSRYVTSYDEFRNGCNVQKGIIRHGNSTDCFSTLSSPGCSSNPKLDREINADDQLASPSSTVFRPMQPQFSNHSYLNHGKDAIIRNSYSSYEPLYPNLSYSTSHQDVIVTTSKVERPFSNLDFASTISYDPEAPGYDIGISSSFAARHNSGLAQECVPRDGCPRNIFPPLKSQPFSTDMEPNSSLNDHESSCLRNEVPLSIVSIPEKRGIDFSEYDNYRSFFFPKPSLDTTLYSEGGYRGGGLKSKEYSSYSWSPSCKNKLLMLGNSGCGYPATFHDICEKNEMPLSENRKVFAASVPFSKDDECSEQDCTQFTETRCVEYHEHVSINYELINTQDHQSMRYDSHKKRNSVFSRLSLAPQVRGQQNSAFDDDGTEMDMSIDKVMAVTSQTCNKRAKAKKSRLGIKQFDDVESNRKRQTISSPKEESDCLTIIFKDKMMDDTITGDKRAEKTPFFDFKRRGQVQKTNEETKFRGCIGSADNGDSSGLQRKRRKLIRPNFSKIVSSDGKLANDNSGQSLLSPVIKNINVSCEASGDTETNENRSSEHVEPPHNTCSIGCEDKNYHTVVGLNCEVDRKDASSDGFLREGVEVETSSQTSVMQCSTETGIPNSEPERGGVTHEKLLQEIENSNQLCPINGEMTISGITSNLNPDTENIPDRVLKVSVSEESEEKSSCLSLISTNEQPRGPDEYKSVRCSPMQDMSQETSDNNIRDAEVPETANGDEDCAMAVQKVENRK